MFRPGWVSTLKSEIAKKDWPMPKDYRKFGLTKGAYVKTDELVKLFILMSYYESGHDPSKTYKESFRDSTGHHVISTGLFQLSVESVRGYGMYASEQTLKDPHHNIKAAVRIFHRWLKVDGVIARRRFWFFGPWRGAARYWSVLRTKSFK